MLSKVFITIAAICFIGVAQAAPLGLPIITDHAAQTSDFDVQAINTSVNDQLGLGLLDDVVGPRAGQHKSQ